jgi:hypothetical protein
MSPVDIGVPCLNVRNKVFFCSTWCDNHSVVWVAVREVGRHIAQTDRQSSSLNFRQSTDQSVGHNSGVPRIFCVGGEGVLQLQLRTEDR